MKQRDITIIGRTNTKGQFLITNKQEMNDYFAQWPNNTFTMQITLEKTGETSPPLIGYYYKKIVPDMQRIFWERGERLTQEQTDERLITLTPISRKESYTLGNMGKPIGWQTEYIKVSSMDNQQLVFFIEQLKDVAASEYGYFIDDPKDISNE